MLLLLRGNLLWCLFGALLGFGVWEDCLWVPLFICCTLTTIKKDALLYEIINAGEVSFANRVAEEIRLSRSWLNRERQDLHLNESQGNILCRVAGELYLIIFDFIINPES